MNQENLIITCGQCGARNRIPKARVNDRPVCGKCRAPLSPKAAAAGRTVPVTDETFRDEVLGWAGLVLVDCWAAWCGPCRMVAPIMEQLAAEYAGRAKIATLNVDENPGTASRFDIRSIPTLLFFKNGTLVKQQVGALPRSEIEGQLRLLL